MRHLANIHQFEYLVNQSPDIIGASYIVNGDKNTKFEYIKDSKLSDGIKKQLIGAYQVAHLAGVLEELKKAKSDKLVGVKTKDGVVKKDAVGALNICLGTIKRQFDKLDFNKAIRGCHNIIKGMADHDWLDPNKIAKLKLPLSPQEKNNLGLNITDQNRPLDSNNNNDGDNNESIS